MTSRFLLLRCGVCRHPVLCGQICDCPLGASPDDEARPVKSSAPSSPARDVVVKVGLAVVRGSRILLVRKRGLESLILPGGKPEPHDLGDPVRTLEREIQEELSCRVRLQHDSLDLLMSPSYLGRFSNRAAGKPHLTVEVLLYLGEIEGEPVPSGEIEALVWVPLDDEASYDVAPSLRDQILPMLRSQRLVREASDFAVRYGTGPGRLRDLPGGNRSVQARRVLDQYAAAAPGLPRDWPYSRQRYAGDGFGSVVRAESSVAAGVDRPPSGTLGAPPVSPYPVDDVAGRLARSQQEAGDRGRGDESLLDIGRPVETEDRLPDPALRSPLYWLGLGAAALLTLVALAALWRAG